jgi:proteasome lid subunit RPN8/RPN11
MDGISRLFLPSDICEQVLTHARTSRPREAVGLLGGLADGQIRKAMPLQNLATGTVNFIADPLAQFRALHRLESENLKLLAIYHSHPGGGVHPSDTDLVFARHWSCVQVIIAIGEQGSGGERVRAFHCGKTGSKEQIEVAIVMT